MLHFRRHRLGRVLAGLLVGLAVLGGTPGGVLADGMIIIEPPAVPPLLPDVALAVKEHRVKVAINNGIATTTIDQVFYNPNKRAVEGTYLFPIPEAAAIANFVATWQGQELKGEVLTKDEARRIYEAIVRRQADPALLEYVGHDLFRARIFPIGPQESRQFKLVYSEVVPVEKNSYVYRYPLNTERFSSQKLDLVNVTVDLTMDQGIKNLYSPSHPIKVKPAGEQKATVVYEDEKVKPDQDFYLFWSVGNDDVGLSFLSYQERGEDGYFLLLASPKVEWPAAKVLPKDIVLILDISGSMSGVKMEQAKEALKQVVNNLNPEDRFAVLYFNGEVNAMQKELIAANTKNKTTVSKEIDKLTAGGSTNIDQALKDGLRLLNRKAGRLPIAVFMTDGEPTVGETELGAIVKNTRASNLAAAKIFVFGVGDDVNAHLLDFVAGDSKGITTYVAPDESITTKVSDFYDKIGSPVLEKLQLKFNGADVYDLYPKELPDLYKGAQISIVGRYRYAAGSKLQVVLSGKNQVGQQSFTSPQYLLGATETRISEVPLLWATRKVGYLLDQIRLYGENKELVQEVTSLSRRYGIINEYTSFLIDVDPELPLPMQQEQAQQRLKESFVARDFSAATGAAGTGAAKSTQALQQAQQAPALAGNDFLSAEKAAQIKRVGAKIFYLAANRWVDSIYHGGRASLAIKYESAAYYQLLDRLPLGPYLALGKAVTVCWRDACYEIGATGEADLTNLEVFTDVSALSWSSRYFRALYDQGALQGTADKRALPEQQITRAELLKLVLKLAKVDTEKLTDEDWRKISRLKDVSRSQWYAALVAKAVSLGIISGYEDGTFRPDKAVTRAEALKIIFRALAISTAGEAASPTAFADVTVQDWFNEYVIAATRRGIVGGYSDGKFRPQALISRAEAAKMVVVAKEKGQLANP